MKKDIPAPNAEPELPPFSENPSMTFFLEAIGWMELGNGEEALSSIEQIVDKYAKITKTKELIATPEKPGYVHRADKL